MISSQRALFRALTDRMSDNEGPFRQKFSKQPLTQFALPDSHMEGEGEPNPLESDDSTAFIQTGADTLTVA